MESHVAVPNAAPPSNEEHMEDEPEGRHLFERLVALSDAHEKAPKPEGEDHLDAVIDSLWQDELEDYKGMVEAEEGITLADADAVVEHARKRLGAA